MEVEPYFADPPVGGADGDPKFDHVSVRRAIRSAKTVEAFRGAYELLEPLLTAVSASQLACETGVWQWCVNWAVARYRRQTWADPYEEARRTCMLYLQCLCDVFESPRWSSVTTATDLLALGPEKIDCILGIYLPMDKANAFYRLVGPGSSLPGMPWYCKLHSDQELLSCGLVPSQLKTNPTMNRRYKLLVDACNYHHSTVTAPSSVSSLSSGGPSSSSASLSSVGAGDGTLLVGATWYHLYGLPEPAHMPEDGLGDVLDYFGDEPAVNPLT